MPQSVLGNAMREQRPRRDVLEVAKEVTVEIDGPRRGDQGESATSLYNR